MPGIIEFDDLETAAINVEVDVSFFKIRGTGFPDLCFRVQCFDCLPCAVTDAFAVFGRINEKKVERIAVGLAVDGQHNATHLSAASLSGASMDSSIV